MMENTYYRMHGMKDRKACRKVLLLLALLLGSGMASAQVLVKGDIFGGGELGKVTQNTTVAIHNGTAEGSAYGGGKGSATSKSAGLVGGNTEVSMTGGQVIRSIYGGGELGSVGTFTEEYSQNDTVGYNVHYQGEPKTCAANTGLAKVLISGGKVGPDEPKMPTPGSYNDRGNVYCGSRGLNTNDSIANLLAVVDTTYLEISGGLIAASVYGGCENGIVLGNTKVMINGGQIGIGYYKDSGGVEHWDGKYDEQHWTTVINNLYTGTLTNDDIQGDGSSFHGFHICDSWPYESPYNVYDIYCDSIDSSGNVYKPASSSSSSGSNGQTFFGNVFGGGSGSRPVAPGVWRRSAGRVNGNTQVVITDGHILSSVYGGNETSDVMGTSTVKMSGGTVGVPRVVDSIKSRPVLCYLYGAGKGDQRTMFNTWTNVDSTHVEITGGTIFGSALGGGEDGHVLRNVSFVIRKDNSSKPTIVGTWGYSGYDGNVFGAGRGFTGDALTAGNVGGNVDMTIEGGLILGNVFGGGRNASVGPKLRNPDDILYGQLQPDDANGTHGYINVTIKGGTIGNDYESKLHHYDTIKGGNVFGGSMGTIFLLDGTTVNDIWPRMARVKMAHVTVKEVDHETNPTIIKGSVFGGGMIGTVADSTSVDIQGGTIWRDVFGGGYGSELNDKKYLRENKFLEDDGTITPVMVTPRRRAGRVERNIRVGMYGGWVKRNVYGGGKLASVGTITNEIGIQSDSDSLSISWPLRLFYKENTGADTVLIKGGRIGITGNDFMGPWQADGTPLIKYNGVYIPYDPNVTGHNDSLVAACEVNGEVYGGGKGKAGDRREMAELADCVKTVVTVNYNPTNLNTATVSNFKPNGFVSDFYSKYDDFTVDGINYGTKGCVVGNLYGAAESGHTHDSTYVTLMNGLIGGNLFGGGKGVDMHLDSLRIVDNSTLGYHIQYDTLVHSITAGKVYGNTYVNMTGGHVLGSVYGGGDLASVGKGNYLGYGETLGSEAISDSANFVLKSGKCYVTINGGIIGTSTYDKHSGHVFGSSRGMTFPSNNKSPRYKYSRDFFLGYSNFTYVTIGDNTGDGPTIYGSVFGGGENGHVRFDSEVTINSGTIGVPFDDNYANITKPEWAYRGNVYGAGRGQDTIAGTDNYCSSAGSVTLNTKVTVNGGTIHRNVYGGGSLASVGPPPTGYNPGTSLNEVIIKGGTIGEVVHVSGTNYDNYGGDIYGGGRGIIDTNAPLTQFATSSNTQVTLDSIMHGSAPISAANIIGNVYGGGELGQVKHTTKVDMKAGNVGTIGYAKKHDTDPKLDTVYHKTGGSVFGGGKGDLSNREAALVIDTTHVTISGGHVQYSVYGGGEVASVGLRQLHRYKYNGVWYDDYLPKQSLEHTDSTGVAMVTIRGGQVGPAPKIDDTHDVKIGLNGHDGYVFGGGKGIGDDPIDLTSVYHYSGKDYYAIADVNNTIVTVDMPILANDTINRIWGSTFGGAEDGHVLGSARTYYKDGLMGTTGTTTYDGNIFGGGRNFSKKNYNAGRVRVNDSIDMCGGKIYGSIFGGGRLALTGIDLYGNIIPDTLNVKQGNTFVKVSGGTVGNDARIEEWISSTMGDVYGAGKGDTVGIAGHPKASALLVSLVKNTEVLITDTIIGDSLHSPRILGSVFGGGEVANVGHFTWKIQQYAGVLNIGDIEQLPGTGKTKVTVKGGTIGADRAQMRLNMASNDPDDHNYDLKYNDDRGHVFGGGEGWTDDPTHYSVINPTTGTPGIHNNKRLIDLMAIVGETDVTIGKTDNGSAYVKGSVYGGAMNGHVLRDTKVTVSGGQIGAGYNPRTGEEQAMYAENKFFNPYTYFGTTHPNYIDVAAGDALLECYHWDYDSIVRRPFDPVAIKDSLLYNQAHPDNQKVVPVPSNGETWFGSVYGGGSGYYPYIVKDSHNNDSCVWNPEAGRVYGNAEVEITGGHILSNVYGGCQTTDVGAYDFADAAYHANHPLVPVGELYCTSGGKTTVTMSGGTVGVPRTLDSIARNPLNGDVFGGGQGDFREQLAYLSNVDSTRVTISGTAIVYGSVFGGAENGHVVDSTKVIINGGFIGITGLSGEEGSVFGGGRGSSHYTNLADTTGLTLYWHSGRVGGNTHVTMTDGNIFGCLYGGGTLALTGVGKDGSFASFVDSTSNYPERIYDSTYHGRALVELSGGTLGNYLIRGGYDMLVSDYELGNVYGGGRGDPSEYVEDDFGRTANAIVRITGNPLIYGSVFGGGQMANVGHWNNYASWYTTKTGTTSVSIKGRPIIGMALEYDNGYSNGILPGDIHVDLPKWTFYDTINGMRMIDHTCTGNVYGAGEGDMEIEEDGTVGGLEHGHCRTTIVNIDMDDPNENEEGGHIRGCVYGGGEQGAIWGETKVTIAGGGVIGTENIPYDSLKLVNNVWVPVHHDSTYSFGSVFGGSYGMDSWRNFADDPNSNFNPNNPHQIDSINGYAGRVYGNTEVNIMGGHIRGNVYGGGDMASVGIWDSLIVNGKFIDLSPKVDPARPDFRGNAKVTVTNGEIGPLDGTGLNAYVFGGGKGFYNDPDTLRKAFANVDSTFVTVSGGKIWGSVFGGGNDSHVLGSAYVKVTDDANIGTNGLTTWDGNIFGGGRNFVNSNHSNGRVAGNIKIEMDGGSLQGSIFGGGRLALTGVDINGNPHLTNDDQYDAENHGFVTINVSGTTGIVPSHDNPPVDSVVYYTSIGNPNGIELLTGSDESVGDIFGSGKGDTKAYSDTLAGRVANTKITLTGSPRIYGSVFGGGEMASLGWWRPTDHLFYENTGRAEITIGRAGDVGQNDNPTIGTSLEFDSDYLNDQFQVNGTPIQHSQWTRIETVNGAKRVFHTCTGNVFGGCQGDVDFDGWVDSDPDTWNNWPYMGRSRTATITINNGTIMGEVFGGSEQGLLDDTTHITIEGGTIGTLATASNGDEYYHGGVYGGGYGSDEENEHDHPITVYGESTTAEMVSGRVYGNTRVDVYGGTIQGDVYGGASFAYVGGEEGSNTGNVLVNIGKESQMGPEHSTEGPTFRSVQARNSRTGGSVYGANNRSGTPYGNVKVNVISTAHTEDNRYPAFAENAEVTPSCLDTLPHAVDNFAIFQVYGGSNKADYIPYVGKADTVHVWDCKENTIYDVYGGCNAASIGSTTNRPINSNVFIDGGRIFRVFGGGNGSGGVSSDIHGTATTEIEGGIINQVFGGSNSLGQIEEVNLLVEDGGTCNLVIGDGFGGGNNAEIYGDVVTNIECGAGSYQNFYGGANLANIYGNVTLNVFGGTFDNLFAGSKGCTAADQIPEYPEGKSADILDNPRTADRKEGNVTLNLFGGNIYDAAYGGSDANGRIEGKIRVNVFNAGGPCDIDLDTVFGAGRATKYEPFYTLEEGETYTYPEVNIIHGTVKGCVFGGGEGVTATTTANPVVNIGYDAVSMGDPNTDETLINTLFDTIRAHYCLETWEAPADYIAYVQKHVYGGGNQGDINGSPTVNIMKHSTIVDGSVFGGGHGKILASNETMQPADSVIGLVHGSDTVRIRGGHVKEYVFGGGELASVEGNTFVELTGGEVGSMSIYQIQGEGGQMVDSIIPGLNIPYYELTGGLVYGGGRGYLATENHNDYRNFGHVKGNTFVHVSDTAKIHDCVFGGGALGSVGSGQLDDKTSGVATVIISGGEIGPLDGSGLNAYVYGGGRGKDEDADEYFVNYANVDSTSVIVCDSARIYGSIFGGGSDGHVMGNVHVQVKKSLDDNSTHNMIPIVGTNGKTSWDGNIFGGGRNFKHTNLTGGRVGGNITITMKDGKLMGSVFGGGRLGSTGVDKNGVMQANADGKTYGHIKVDIQGGTVGNEAVTDPVQYESYRPYLGYIGHVFGGAKGKEDNTNFGLVKNTEVIISEKNDATPARILGNVYGGSEDALVQRATTEDVGIASTSVIVNAGTIGVIDFVRKQQTLLTEPLDSIVHRHGGSVFGGGKGNSTYRDAGLVYGNSNVTIYGGHALYSVYGGGEMGSVGTITAGELVGGLATVTVIGGQVGPAPALVKSIATPANDSINVTIGLNGHDGYVFGGGKGNGIDPITEQHPSGQYFNFANVNYTSVTIDMPMPVEGDNDANRLWGSVFGGAEDGHVLGSDTVRFINGLLGTTGTTSYDGNIFGGGRNFNKKNYTAGFVAGNNLIEMSGGQILGSIFGGGRLGITGISRNGIINTDDDFQVFETNANTGKATVRVKGGIVGNPALIETFTKYPMGDVYGGGKGDMVGIAGHDVASALLLSLTRETVVEISEDDPINNPTIILGNVYGGGEVANVGNYGWTTDQTGTSFSNIHKVSDGETNVTISGGRIGVDRMRMHYELVGGNGPDKYNFAYNTVGNVFGGGKGYGGDPEFSPKPEGGDANKVNTVYGVKYLADIMGTVGSTDVTVTGVTTSGTYRAAWVKGSVYGGSPMGHVLEDTWVKIQGGQIGAGDCVNTQGQAVDSLYVDSQFVKADTTNLDLHPEYALKGAHHWAYTTTQQPFDPVLIYNDMQAGEQGYTYDYIPTDGKTWFGNVYGGGSGFLPYVRDGQSVWNREAGKVYGNTRVEISGGHILSCVYGGCEVSDVGLYTYDESIHGQVHSSGGKAEIIMTGGTVGVPRITDSIKAHPVPGYVYGSGKGDPRLYFNTWTNVNETYDTIKGGYIYGCLFGSGEDGHVLGDAAIEVSEADGINHPTVIGSTGLSRADGNIFGGGRGTTVEALTAGSVDGNINVSVLGGKMLGSVYGGGNFSSVGIYLVDKLLPNGDPNPYYGKFQDGTDHGYITINISGGCVGNDNETPTQANPTTIGGNVFGGSMGQLSANNVIWPSLARVKQTNVTITNDTIGEGNAQVVRKPWVKASVYGGGQVGTVRDDATVNVRGGIVGTEYGTPPAVHFHFGSVYGGGQGLKDYSPQTNDSTINNGIYKLPVEIAGRVYGNTFVNISGGLVRENVFGGGEVASVGWVKTVNKETTLVNGVCTITMNGGEVGPLDMTGLNGYVYGGSEGVDIDLTSDQKGNYKNYCNVNETHVTVENGNSGGQQTSPHVYGSLFGGGSDGHVLGDAEVNFHGGTLGTTGTTTWDGNIFGGGRNFKATNITAGRVEGNIHVNMTGGTMLGNIYGGGRLASTGVDVNGDTIAGTNHGHILVEVTGGTIGNNDTITGPSSIGTDTTAWVGQFGGNIFGGAMGYDLKPDSQIPSTLPTGETDPNFAAYTDSIRSHIAWVKNTEVKVGGVADTAFVWGNVFGGGKAGRVYRNTKVTIEGASVIGVYRGDPDHQMAQTKLDSLFYSGSVYGGSLGSESSVQPNSNHLWPDVGRVYGNDSVFIKNKEGKVPLIRNKIYGGGALACMGTVDENGIYTNDKPTGNTYVEMSGGKLGPLDMSGVNAYVYGGGMGQPAYIFKDFGKVNNTHLVVKDEAIVYGSIFGGGEDGHVVGNALIDMDGGALGTSGTTTWDGNIFGGGRNFEAAHETTGRVGGNVTINIKKGTMLGSVFGGGRLGSVGVNDLDGDNFAMQSGNDHGFVTINIGGDDEKGQTGIINIGHAATSDEDRVGGNVYGGGKGIAGDPRSIYPSLAQVKETTVNIKERKGAGYETWIEGSVFGSGEDGHVLQNAHVNVYGGQIGGLSYNPENPTPCQNNYHGNVYGAGRGVDKYKEQATDGEGHLLYDDDGNPIYVQAVDPETNTPLTDDEGNPIYVEHFSETAGRVGINTYVNIYGGRIVRNVYGGGNLSSVGDPNEPQPAQGQQYQTGLATVNILGGTIGFDGEGSAPHYDYKDYGNVFGSGHGGIGGEYLHLAYVKNTHVTVDSSALIYGSVFGGGEDGHVRHNTLVDIKGGVIGQEHEDFLHGNVYGGGRGLIQANGTVSPTAGEVFGYSTVNLMQSERMDEDGEYYKPVIWNNVYGGGSRSVVGEYKVVNISDGTVHDHVFGGSRDIPAVRPNKAPRWVNMWGGTVEGNLYGCSHNSIDSVGHGTKDDWASFINLSGGTVKGNVFGAGYGGDPEGIIVHEERGGVVGGSVAVLIGKKAIESANLTANVHKPATIVKDSLNIQGSVFAGADMVHDSVWGEYAVSGYSHIYIDGTGYNTTDNHVANYMNVAVAGGIYGSGNNCEAGKSGHDILFRNYGARNSGDELTEASRSLKTIQRAGTVILDSVNVNLKGDIDIARLSTENDSLYGVMKVDTCLYVTNSTGIVLGTQGTPATPSTQAIPGAAYMDGIKEVRSLYLKDDVNMYQQMASGDESNWYVIGIKEEEGNKHLYRVDTVAGQAGIPTGPLGNALTAAEENVIIFNDTSALFVRYQEGNTKVYGELQGFFRMQSPFSPYGTQSFAYARPKLTVKNVYGLPASDELNKADGGFLSYDNTNNFYTRVSDGYPEEGDDGGDTYTETKQYPYTNVLEPLRDGFSQYRLWVLLRSKGRNWYVDGRTVSSGIGQDNMDNGRGLYPDMPKQTVTRTLGIYDGAKTSSGTPVSFIQKEDAIYVVGAINGNLEVGEEGNNHKLNRNSAIPLRLYRYPGGHTLSSEGVTDPGANYGALVETFDNGNDTLTLNKVIVDGLYGYVGNDGYGNVIPPTFDPTNDTMPLVVTYPNSKLVLNDSTVLKNGYNGIDAAGTVQVTEGDALTTKENYYYNPYFNGEGVYNGGAMYVDPDAKVMVEDKVYITGNKQKKGDGEPIYCNVYLPTFDTHLEITNELDDGSEIGITSPICNDGRNYLVNTLSPVAIANKSNPATGEENNNIALNAWRNRNFHDDLGWFFVSGHSKSDPRTTYYDNSDPNSVLSRKLFFGWTWANVVRKAPDGFAYSNIDSPEDLAWLISESAGMNGQTAIDFSNVGTIKQTHDFSLKQYVWVPLGEQGTGYEPFAGKFDGQGHIIDSVCIEYIGKGDSIYERHNYGLFGYVHNGTVDRTFVVSGHIKPTSTYTITVAADPTEGGSVTVTGDGTYVYGSSVTLTATPNSNYSFTHWQDGNTDNPRTIIVTGTATYTAHFITGDKSNSQPRRPRDIYPAPAREPWDWDDDFFFPPDTLRNGSKEVVNPVSTASFGIGGLVGYMDGTSVVSNSEAAVTIICPNNVDATNAVGGLVGVMDAGEIHSSMAMPWITTLSNFNGTVGGLVGNAKGSTTAPGAIYNSFVNGKFSLDGVPKAGGLLGVNDGATMQNCYVNWGTEGSLGSTFKSIVNEVNSGTVDYCYAKTETGVSLGTVADSHNKNFTDTDIADKYGYMYLDNTVPKSTTAGTTVDTAMFRMMNEWVDDHNPSAYKYARWARPGLREINGDYPVLLLNDPDRGDDKHQGVFRSVATIPGLPNVLQYGGPVRDGAGNIPDYSANDGNSEINGALDRLEANNALFIYGDIIWDRVDTLPAQKTRISIQEDVAILHPGTLGTYDSTYVGITFDNSFGKATASPGINPGLYGSDHLDLPRDWHMFSSPLSDAPLGFNYNIKSGDDVINTNETGYPGSVGNNYYNNPWVTPSDDFSWLKLNDNDPDSVRYWMYGWENSQSQHASHDLDADTWKDGYFPSQTTEFGAGLIEGTDEWHPSTGWSGKRYPYGMDFYTWNEPQYHWINFKRNGPNHWHSDDPHDHLDYLPAVAQAGQTPYTMNQNEDTLIVGRGYMAAIATETFMQSHGTLNEGPQGITLTYSGAYCTGWNLVGNPYHGYLDFHEFAINEDNKKLLGDTTFAEGPGRAPFYVVYDADQYDKGKPKNAFIYYPDGGSINGAYAKPYLHPHQGFFVMAKGAGSLNFTEDMIVPRRSITSNFRDQQPAYPLVNLFLSSDHGCSDITVVEFERPEWGGATKLRELRRGNGLFYGYHDEHSYAAIFAKEGATRVPLWFEAKEDDIFTMKWNTANGDFNSLYLIDNILGVQYDMLANDTYMFEGHKQDYKARFYIVFDVTGVEEEFEQNIFAFFDGSQWVVTGEGELDLVDLQGRTLWHEKLSGGQSRLAFPTLAKSMYLLRLTNSSETKVQKIIVK